MLRHAFKEWAVICKALAEGRQALILRKGGIAVTTFDTLPRLEFLDRAPHAEISALIVDEAHFIKNPQAKRTAAVTDLGERAWMTLYLTGTPMEK